MSAMVRLQDVARAAGVSKMTVSNVLNGRVGQVSEETSQRVTALAKKLGYEPNAAARALSAAKSDIIVLVYNNPEDGTNALENPHDALILGEVERCVTAAGKHLMVHAGSNVADTARRLRSWNADGAIFLGVVAEHVPTLRSAHDVPMVFIDAYGEEPIASVGLDDHLSGYLSTKHLMDAGHRNIGFVGPLVESSGVIRARYNGYLEALRETSGCLEATFWCDTVFEEAKSLAPTLLADDREITGVVTTADVIAAGLFKGVTDMGRDVPTDLSIIGFDDTLLARALTPGLTSMHQDIAAKARAAVDVIVDQLRTGPRPQQVVLTPQLIERESVGSPRPTRTVATSKGRVSSSRNT